METFAWVAATSSVVTGLLVGLQFLTEQIRGARLRDLELTPNCLLTRYPIVFVTGQRSLFCFGNYWNQIPGFLAEHGYEIEVLDLPWRTKRFEAAEAILAKRTRPCHLIIDSSQESELKNLIGMPQIVSMTITKAQSSTTGRTLQPEHLRPRTDGIQVLHLPITNQVTLKGLFLIGHNLFKTGNATIPAEVGATSPAKTFPTERKFLEHAISLAERDAR